MRKFNIGEFVTVSPRMLNYDWDIPPYIAQSMVDLIGEKVQIVPQMRVDYPDKLVVYKACTETGVCYFFLEDWLDHVNTTMGSRSIYDIKGNNDEV